MGEGPTQRGLSRKHIMDQIDATLQRPRDRPCRSLLHPPARPGHAVRGDADGARRHRAGRKGALSRRVVHVDVAVREAAGNAARPTGWPPSLPCENFYNLAYREEERENDPLLPFGRSWGSCPGRRSPALPGGRQKRIASPSKRAGEDNLRSKFFGSPADLAILKRVESPWRNGRGSRLRRWRLPG